MKRVYRLESEYGDLYYVCGEPTGEYITGLYLHRIDGEGKMTASTMPWSFNLKGFMYEVMPEQFKLEDFI